jgi:hypothetical protein
MCIEVHCLNQCLYPTDPPYKAFPNVAVCWFELRVYLANLNTLRLFIEKPFFPTELPGFLQGGSASNNG